MLPHECRFIRGDIDLNIKKKVSVMILVCLMAMLLSLTVSVSASEPLTLDRAVQVSDTEIVLEFSEPVAFNFNYKNSGPFTAIRLVQGANDDLMWENGNPLHISGYMSYLDSKHDRVLWTVTGALGNNMTVTDVLACKNDLAKYAGVTMKFCIEEIPYYDGVGLSDAHICNVTNADGTVELTASRPIGWDGVYVPIDVDFDYKYDLNECQPLDVNEEDGFDISVMSIEEAKEKGIIKEKEVIIKETKTGPNKLIIFGVLGGAAVITAVIVTVAAFAGRKKK